MLSTRVIPALLLRDGALVKTTGFDKYSYVGDPINTVRIFNELEVDELIFLDILATRSGSQPDFDLLREISNECFMPLTYGGAVTSVDDVARILDIGLEKVVLNSSAIANPDLISQASARFGNQAILVAIDVRKNFWGKREVWGVAGTRNAKLDPVEWAKKVAELGAGEIVLTSIDREGSWNGLDLDLIAKVTEAVDVPVIAHGGAGTIDHIVEAVDAGASAVALGSMVVFQQKGLGVLVNFPDKTQLTQRLRKRG